MLAVGLICIVTVGAVVIVVWQNVRVSRTDDGRIEVSQAGKDEDRLRASANEHSPGFRPIRCALRAGNGLYAVLLSSRRLDSVKTSKTSDSLRIVRCNAIAEKRRHRMS